MEELPTKLSTDTVETELFINSLNRLMNDYDDETSNDSADDTNTNRLTLTDQTQSSFTNLINDLLKTNPNAEYGHFESYANAMYCHDCQLMLWPKYVSQIPCKVPEFIVEQDGTVTYIHTKCEKLDLSKYIHSLAEESGSWEKTYWHLWSECHFLSCTVCKLQYPVRNSGMCLYHPEKPEYFPIGDLGLEQPIGRYPCCGERAFRFELVKNPFGCKYRMHVPNKKNLFCQHIMNLVCSNMEMTVASPPALNHEKKIMKFVCLDPGIKRQNHQHWWTKLTFGTNGYIYQPMISLGYNFLNCQKKRKNWKELNKRRIKNFFELKKWMNNKPSNINPPSNSSIIFKESPEITSQMSSDNSNKDLTTQGSFWKIHSPMISIQDSQREQDSLIFDLLTVKLIKSRKGEKGSPGSSDQLRDSYTLVRENMLAKIESHVRPSTIKSTKLFHDKKRK
ncbi:uncharacterized protein KIAA1841 homolog [Rhopalosiphum maidis]|uniref:uncharacterized protein KIAA1841 homolog n=1 Tax=Rhopalosiphum maidis TaxID=43146 RepID=UPI000EFFCBC1|nr:uncharacterized protein KIAA1841 homolog [Rhopalosiphum maidis]